MVERAWITFGLRWILAIALLVLSTCISPTDSKYIQGVLTTKEDWTFLARFCFLSNKGRLSFEFKFPMSYEPQTLLFYYDTAEQWPAVYKVEMSCINKTSPPHILPENNQMVTLHHLAPACSEAPGDPTHTQCSAERFFRTAWPRWWYLALSRCSPLVGTPQGMSIEYKIWMTNGDDLFHEQFSADEFYILEVDIAFLLATFLLCILSIVFAVKLSKRQMWHSTFKLFMVSISFELLHLLVKCIAYGKYANDGLDMYATKTFARVLEAVSILVFILMLILMAKGFTITRGRISHSGSIKIAIFMTVYTITYAVLFIYEAEIFDPGLVLYIYESPAGFGLIALRIIAWIWFIYAIFFTLKNYPKKNKFYYPFCIFYSLWFWFGPIIILISSFAIPDNERESVVNGIERGVSFLGFSAFLFLTRPSNANKNFPYHVRTSQVCAMTEQEAGAFPADSSHSELSAANSSKESSVGGSSGRGSGWRAAPIKGAGPNFTELFTVTPRPSQNLYTPSPSGDGGGSSMGVPPVVGVQTLGHGSMRQYGDPGDYNGWKPNATLNSSYPSERGSDQLGGSGRISEPIYESPMEPNEGYSSPRAPDSARGKTGGLTTFNPRILASSYNEPARNMGGANTQTPRENGSAFSQSQPMGGASSRTPQEVGGASSLTAQQRGGSSYPAPLASIAGNSRATPFSSSGTLPPINPFITRHAPSSSPSVQLPSTTTELSSPRNYSDEEN